MITEAIIMDDEKLKQASEEDSYDVSANTIIDVVKEGSEIYSEVTAAFVKDFVFYDKTLYEWATELMIHIPKARDLDEVGFRALLIDLANNIQVATVNATNITEIQIDTNILTTNMIQV